MPRVLVFLLLFAIGCRGKSEADSGEEFFEKWSDAARAKDVETLWKMLTEDSQAFYTESAKQELDRARGNPDAQKKIKMDYDLTQDVDSLDPVVLAKAKIKLRLSEEPWSFGQGRFVGEEQDGSDLVVTIDSQGVRKVMILEREKRYLRIDVVDTGKRNATR